LQGKCIIMSTFLFDKTVFGPVHSRRMGISLGINLLPVNSKCCTFNCIYCECGWTTTPDSKGTKLPTAGEVAEALESRLSTMSPLPDAITFAGNGEPTIHPDFAKIIDDTVRLRDQYAPKSLISVLSNGTRLYDPAVFKALQRADMNIQKLDAGTEKTLRLINQPNAAYTLETVVEQLCRFNGKVIVQTLFLRGQYLGQEIDNTTDEEITPWIGYLKRIKPEYVMIYPIERETPASGLVKVTVRELEAIADKVRGEGIEVRVYG
jgi:wyosine [tRNA(Phe)-imidazoG37] synthetase (radical SAM superfamily)